METRICGSCTKEIEERSLIIGDIHYHPDCFVCSECKKPINGSFFPKGTGFVCLTCGSTTCAACKKSIQGKSINAMGDTFHAQCFVCSTCKKPIDGKFSRVNNKIVCMSCKDKYEQELTEKNTQARLEAQRKGEEAQRLRAEQQRKEREEQERAFREKRERERQEQERLDRERQQKEQEKRALESSAKSGSAIKGGSGISRKKSALSDDDVTELGMLLNALDRIKKEFDGAEGQGDGTIPYETARERVLDAAKPVTGLLEKVIATAHSMKGLDLCNSIIAFSKAMETAATAYKDFNSIPTTPKEGSDQIHDAFAAAIAMMPAVNNYVLRRRNNEDKEDVPEVKEYKEELESAFKSAEKLLKDLIGYLPHLPPLPDRVDDLLAAAAQTESYSNELQDHHAATKDTEGAVGPSRHVDLLLQVVNETMRLTSEAARSIGQLRLNPEKEAANRFAKEQLNNAVLEIANDLAPRFIREAIMIAKGSTMPEARNRLLLGGKKVMSHLTELARYAHRLLNGDFSGSNEEAVELSGGLRASLGIFTETLQAIKEGRSAMFAERSPAKSPARAPSRGSVFNRPQAQAADLSSSEPSKRKVGAQLTVPGRDASPALNSQGSSNKLVSSDPTPSASSSAPAASGPPSGPNPNVDARKGLTPSQIIAEERKRQEEERQRRAALLRGGGAKKPAATSAAAAEPPKPAAPAPVKPAAAKPPATETDEEREKRLQREAEEEEVRREEERLRAEEEALLQEEKMLETRKSTSGEPDAKPLSAAEEEVRRLEEEERLLQEEERRLEEEARLLEADKARIERQDAEGESKKADEDKEAAAKAAEEAKAVAAKKAAEEKAAAEKKAAEEKAAAEKKAAEAKAAAYRKAVEEKAAAEKAAEAEKKATEKKAAAEKAAAEKKAADEKAVADKKATDEKIAAEKKAAEEKAAAEQKAAEAKAAATKAEEEKAAADEKSKADAEAAELKKQTHDAVQKLLELAQAQADDSRTAKEKLFMLGDTVRVVSQLKGLYEKQLKRASSSQ